MNNSKDTQNGKRVYVWLICTSTLLLLGLIVWPLTVDRFQTTSVFSLRYQPTSGIEKARLNLMVVDALKKQTERNGIADIVAQLDTEMTSRVLNSMDPETIRKSIHIKGRPGKSANSMEYRLSMVGEGGRDEVEFLNAIVSGINRQLEEQLTRNNSHEVVQQFALDLEKFHSGRLSNVSDQLSTLMNDLVTIENDIGIVSSDLQEITSSPVSRRPSVLGRPSTEALNNLYEARQRLLDQPGMTEYHPDVTDIQRRIEALRGDTKASGGEFRKVRNPYVNDDPGLAVDTSAGSPFQARVSQVLDGIEMVDVSAARVALSDIQNSIREVEPTGKVIGRLSERAVRDLQTESPLAMSSFEMAKRSSPLGGSPNVSQFLLLALFAGVFGTMVTLNYDPAIRRTPFRTVEQLQRKLNVPVIGVLRNRTAETHHPLGKRTASRVLQMCEWTLLILAVLLILAALANSEVAAAFIENPFHGITKTIWLMSPNS